MAHNALVSTQRAPEKAITGATQANPCVVTALSHGLATGDKVLFRKVGGMVELNELSAQAVTVLDGDTFSIAVDSTPYGLYTSGGILEPVMDVEVLDLGMGKGAMTLAAVLSFVNSLGVVVPATADAPAPVDDKSERPGEDKAQNLRHVANKTNGPLVPALNQITTVADNAETAITPTPAAGSNQKVALRCISLYSANPQKVTLKTQGGAALWTTIDVPAAVNTPVLDFGGEPLVAATAELPITVTSTLAAAALEVIARYELQPSA